MLSDINLTRAVEAGKHGVPWLLAELGVADTVEHFDLHLHDLMWDAGRLRLGWTYYDYGKGGGEAILDAQGNGKSNLWPLIRTYPQRVAGGIERFSFDPWTKVFELAWREKEGLRAATEIYVPTGRVYAGHFRVRSTDPEGRWSSSFDPLREVLAVYADPSTPTHALTIEPADSPGEPAGRQARVAGHAR